MTTKKPLNSLFPDPGLQLAVLGGLTSAGVLTAEEITGLISGIAEKDYDLDNSIAIERRRATEALELLGRLSVSQDDLDKITALSFDGGDDIYMTLEDAIDISTGGEEDWYECTQLKGIEALKNLKSIFNDGYFRVDEFSQSEQAFLKNVKGIDGFFEFP